MPAPVRYPNGVTNSSSTSAMAALPIPDPTKVITWFDDFHDYNADQWVITTTEAGVSSATEATSSANGGVLVVTNDSNDTDADYLQWSGVTGTGAIESFKFIAGKQLWFKARWKASDVTDTGLVMGLQITDTAPTAVSDGVFFYKADTSTTLNLIVEKDSTETSTAVGTMVADTYVVTAFHYDGKSAIKVYLNDAHVGTSAVTNLPDDEELTISFGILNGSAVAHVLSIDYIFVATER